MQWENSGDALQARGAQVGGVAAQLKSEAEAHQDATDEALKQLASRLDAVEVGSRGVGATSRAARLHEAVGLDEDPQRRNARRRTQTRTR